MSCDYCDEGLPLDTKGWHLRVDPDDYEPTQRIPCEDIDNRTMHVVNSLITTDPDAARWMQTLWKRAAELEKTADAAHWLVSNRGHRGEEQAWRLLEEALGIHPPALRDERNQDDNPHPDALPTEEEA